MPGFKLRSARDARFLTQRPRSTWKEVNVPLSVLRDDSRLMIENRLCENTVVGYCQGWMAWCEFCCHYNLDLHTVSEDILCNFSS